jgi:hypothetical protein
MLRKDTYHFNNFSEKIVSNELQQCLEEIKIRGVFLVSANDHKE